MKSILFLFLLSTSVFSAEMKLIGKALLEYSIFKIDVYEISYLRSTDKTEELRLDYKRDIAKKYSIEGWDVGLKSILKKDASLQPGAKWLKDNSVDMKEGDLFVIRKQVDTVTLLKNGKVLSSIKDLKVARLAFEPWLGEKPVDDDLKTKLIGK